MKRFHVHVAVDEIQKSIQFYSTLFGAAPSVEKPDYAKWMLDDPRVNFAISQRGAKPGVDHFGIQVETDAELGALREQLARAEMPVFDEGRTECCYALSDKHWVTDPTGLAWETYRTLDTIPTFNAAPESTAACCTPTATKAPVSIPLVAKRDTQCCGG
jgi:hypothetical protein